MDFVRDVLASGRRRKCLTVAHYVSHESVNIAVDHSISTVNVVRVLVRAAWLGGYPSAAWTDKGPEFTSPALAA